MDGYRWSLLAKKPLMSVSPARMHCARVYPELPLSLTQATYDTPAESAKKDMVVIVVIVVVFIHGTSRFLHLARRS